MITISTGYVYTQWNPAGEHQRFRTTGESRNETKPCTTTSVFGSTPANSNPYVLPENVDILPRVIISPWIVVTVRVFLVTLASGPPHGTHETRLLAPENNSVTIVDAASETVYIRANRRESRQCPCIKCASLFLVLHGERTRR